MMHEKITRDTFNPRDPIWAAIDHLETLGQCLKDLHGTAVLLSTADDIDDFTRRAFRTIAEVAWTNHQTAFANAQDIHAMRGASGASVMSNTDGG